MKTIVCVWPATLVGADQHDEFNVEMSGRFNRPVRFIESVETKPSFTDSETGEENQSRTDVFFEIEDFEMSELFMPFAILGILPIYEIDDAFITKMRERDVYEESVMEKYFLTESARASL